MSIKEKPFTLVMGCDTFAPDVNGAARFTERLCAGLVQRGINVEVVAPASTKNSHGTKIEVVEGVEMRVHRLKSHKLWGHEWIRFVTPWVARKHARKLLQDLKVDAVHVQSHILVGRAFAAEAKRLKINLVATNHVMPENLLDLQKIPNLIKKPFLKLGWLDLKRVVSKAKHVTTPTRKAADFLERNTAIQNVMPISCGLKAAVYSYDLHPKDTNNLVFVGRLNQEKQVDVALRALALSDPRLEISFDVVGGGDQLQNLKQLAADLGVSERVTWHGKVSDEKLREVLKNGSIFVMPSIAELQSIATLEAMASGLPVLAANAMALPHLVAEGENGYLFEPGNEKDLADKIERIIKLDHSDYVLMQKGSLDIVAEHDIERTIDAFEKLYRSNQQV